MDNEKPTNATKQDGTVLHSEGEKSVSIVDEAKKIRDEIRAENDRREKILKEEQNLQAERMLGGNTGSNIPPQEPKEESAKEYADRVMKNSV